MKPLFVYGTLRDEALLLALLGGSLAGRALRVEAAHAPDRRAVCDGADYPVLAISKGDRVAGALLHDLPKAAMARLAAYEGSEYRLSPIVVGAEGADPPGRSIDALVFEPVVPPPPDAPDWSYEAWRADGAAWRREAAAELGRLYDLAVGRAGGYADPEALTALTELWPDLLGGAARRLGEPGPLGKAFGARFGREAVSQIRCDRVHEAYFKVDRVRLRHKAFRSPEGLGPEIDREVFRVGEAVAVLPYDPAADRVLLIEQFRPGPLIAGDAEPWLFEIVAGRIDAATPATASDPVEATARREAMEEAGLTLGRLERFDLGYASPGATDETLALYLAEARLPPDAGVGAGDVRVLGQHGLAQEGEDIRVFSLGFERALEALSAGEIRNLPAQLGLLWLARRRPQLQALWSRAGPLD